jgi:hypothetical protein
MSWRVRSQIKEFQREHQQQDPLQQNTASHNNGQSSANNTTANKPKAGDYIDFEEVKE